MQKVNLELQEAVLSTMDFAYVAWEASEGNIAAQDLMEELSVFGYKIVKDDAE